ncbi:helix-turn-helix transcriptional regulator [Mesorhizobium sp.]|uniref:helix-turn-helix domain-containing protein n=1 Tax=Mesorhizobium sp. TaxID=1871066 RepID=UPI0011F60154|nr:helix-turn-helix transcriptional regulator [Mesorhizobium sp.]TIL38591.1 MAG: helix-turn-helix transcriptional regulator [Mesorhizobium sp.]
MGDLVGIELGRRIKELREAAQLTQANLAALSLKSVETISNFERGKTVPSVATLHELARHLGCAVADFFSTTPAPPASDPLIKAIANKSGLLGEHDRALLAGFVDLLISNSRR